MKKQLFNDLLESVRQGGKIIAKQRGFTEPGAVATGSYTQLAWSIPLSDISR